MNDRNLTRGIVLMAISLAFGLGALRYPIGELSHAGAGLFPLMIASLLLVVAIATVIRSRFTERVPLGFNIRNILLVVGSLCAFSLVSQIVNMTAGIVALVFCATLAGSSYSWQRNLKISLGLWLVALAFYKLLGVQLPLF